MVGFCAWFGLRHNVARLRQTGRQCRVLLPDYAAGMLRASAPIFLTPAPKPLGAGPNLRVLPPWAQWACRTRLALCLRPGHAELCSLTWDALDWQAKSVTVFMSKVGADKVVYPPDLAEAWERYQAPRRHDYVCQGGRGGRLSYKTFAWTWEHGCKSVGVKMAPYAMRHIAASMMLAGGADMAAVAAQLGHANITTTATFYTHAVPSARRRAATVNPLVHLVQIGAESEGKSGH